MDIKPTEKAQCIVELMDWLHECWLLKQAGQEIRLDPFYSRNELLTPDIVDAVIAQHEANLVYEIEHFPVYHSVGQGHITREEALMISPDKLRAMLKPTGFDQLPYEQRFAIVQGIDRVLDSHRMSDEDRTVTTIEAAQPAEDVYWC